MRTAILKALLFFVFISLHACEQKEKTTSYNAENFSLTYPVSWQMTEEKGILNFFPKDDYGAVTISSYSGINFPLEKTKDFILEMNQINDIPENVKMITKENQTEFYYENIDKNLNWVTKAIRKNTDFYLLTVNCQTNRWKRDSATFMKVLQSFKLN